MQVAMHLGVGVVCCLVQDDGMLNGRVLGKAQHTSTKHDGHKQPHGKDTTGSGGKKSIPKCRGVSCRVRRLLSRLGTSDG
jgi:hypothetical protein